MVTFGGISSKHRGCWHLCPLRPVTSTAQSVPSRSPWSASHPKAWPDVSNCPTRTPPPAPRKKTKKHTNTNQTGETGLWDGEEQNWRVMACGVIFGRSYTLSYIFLYYDSAGQGGNSVNLEFQNKLATPACEQMNLGERSSNDLHKPIPLMPPQ